MLVHAEKLAAEHVKDVTKDSTPVTEVRDDEIARLDSVHPQELPAFQTSEERHDHKDVPSDRASVVDEASGLHGSEGGVAADDTNKEKSQSLDNK